jgi:superfamily II DNA/RNA helicase
LELVIAFDRSQRQANRATAKELVLPFGGVGEKEAVPILVVTEVASEGLNLHYLSHRLVHCPVSTT